jgi:cytidine deaminase
MNDRSWIPLIVAAIFLACFVMWTVYAQTQNAERVERAWDRIIESREKRSDEDLVVLRNANKALHRCLAERQELAEFRKGQKACKCEGQRDVTQKQVERMLEVKNK